MAGNKSSKNLRERGNVAFGMVLLVGTFTSVLMWSANSTIQQREQVNKTSTKSSLRVLKKQLMFYFFNNERVTDNLFSTASHQSTPVNQTSSNLGVRCILDTRNILGSPAGTRTACVHKKMPTSFDGNCEGLRTLEDKQFCWVLENLKNYKVNLVFKGDALLNSNSDILIDNREQDGGLSPSFSLCKEFNQEASCSFRVEVYAWVECSGSQPQCGGETGIPGTIKMAALVIASNELQPLNGAPFSLYDISKGNL